MVAGRKRPSYKTYMIQDMIEETARLQLRELLSDDAEFVLRLVNEPLLLANIGDKEGKNLEDARRFILEGPWTGQQQPGYGQFLIELKQDRTPIGVCGLLHDTVHDLGDLPRALKGLVDREAAAGQARSR